MECCAFNSQSTGRIIIGVRELFACHTIFCFSNLGQKGVNLREILVLAWCHERIQKVLSERVQLWHFFFFFSLMRGGRIKKIPLLAGR